MDDSILIAPVVYEDFMESYWESQPLHVSRKDTGHFSHLLSVEGIKSFVDDNAVIYPSVLVVNSRSVIPVADYTNDQREVYADKLFQQHENGGTIIVNEVHRKFAAVSELCAQVNRAISFAVRRMPICLHPETRAFTPTMIRTMCLYCRWQGERPFDFTRQT